MADESDCEAALVAFVAAAVYPNGTAEASVSGGPVRIRRGWPLPDAVDQDIKAGASRISVCSQPGHTRNVTRYPQAWHSLPTVTPTITVSTPDNLNFTLAGTPSAGQNIGCLCAATGYIVAAQAGDTLTDVATGLAAQIDGASSDGPVLTLATPGTVTIAAVQGALSELRRQQQGFIVTCWCPTPQARDALAAATDVALAGISFLALPDQQAQIKYSDTRISDTAENETLYRRDLIYTVEYGTTATIQAAPVIFPIGVVEGPGGVLVDF